LERVSPALREQTGQAPGPCEASTRWATAICCDLEARSPRGVPRAPVGTPRPRGELQPPVEAVARVDVPVAARLALGDCVPDGGGLRRPGCDDAAHNSGGSDDPDSRDALLDGDPFLGSVLGLVLHG
jgi:hypothetical protein